MNYKIRIVITLQITLIWTHSMQQDLQQMQHPSMTSQRTLQQETPMTSAPLQIEPRQLFMTSQLQRQLQALQQMQTMQNLNTVHVPSPLYLPQPFLVILPNPPIQENEESNIIGDLQATSNINEVKHKGPDKEYIDEELESVIIDAETKDEEKIPQRTVLLVPSSRISIGEIISGIPWLPFEINVPDTIAWAWNGISSGISGIISIIGQRLPFRPRPQMSVIPETQGTNVKMFLKQLQMKQTMMPMLMVPMQRPMFPMQI